MVSLKEKKQKRKTGGKTRLIYYISDTHFRDKKIFDKCNRPFDSVEDMEKQVIKRWNNKINDEDIVYVLGDIGQDEDISTISIFKTLKGHKHLIVGNHDHQMLEEIRNSNVFESIKFIDLITDDDYKVCICHYPLMDWMEFNRDGLLVYGHIHNKTEKNGYAYKLMKEYYKDLKAFNAGVDVIGFEPRTLKELMMLKEANKDESYIN